jgi:Ser/Thr protein kinase RdoA (MazF antagonist)
LEQVGGARRTNLWILGLDTCHAFGVNCLAGNIMKPFADLSQLGRIRRMRQLAQVALNAYGLYGASLSFLRQAGNTLFRVNDAYPAAVSRAELYTPGQYMLRIHQPGYQTTGALELELAWLAAMRREEDLPVPEPVSALDGRLLIQVSIPGIPRERNCSLLRWVRGRQLGHDEVGPRHYRAQGQLMARLHNHAARWQSPPGPTKRKYDWEGLFREDGGAGIPASEAWALLPPAYVTPYAAVAGKVKLVMDAWGQGPDVYGLIHGDLGIDANVLFRGGEARAIDFDDSGFGYYVYDLSLALEHCQEDERLPQFRDALLDGYRRVRSLPDDQAKYLELFLAAYYVFWSLWAAAVAHRVPSHRDELSGRMARAFRLVEFLDCGRVGA